MSVERVIIGSNNEITLYRADCYDLLGTRLLKDVECIVSDPPYGVDADCDYTRFTDKKSEIEPGVKEKAAKHFRGVKHKQVKGDDVGFDPRPFLADKFKEVILWGAIYFCKHIPMGTWLIWKKKQGKALGTFLSDAEIAWQKGGKGVYLFDHEWSGYSRASERGDYFHPTQKPILLMEWCIQRTKAELVFDPFMGAGSTGVAAIRQKRKFIGVEIEPEYFEKCCIRIEKEFAQGKLF